MKTEPFLNCTIRESDFRGQDEVATPGRTLQCTGLMVEINDESEWKHGSTKFQGKLNATSNLYLSSPLMDKICDKP